MAMEPTAATVAGEEPDVDRGALTRFQRLRDLGPDRSEISGEGITPCFEQCHPTIGRIVYLGDAQHERHRRGFALLVIGRSDLTQHLCGDDRSRAASCAGSPRLRLRPGRLR